MSGSGRGAVFGDALANLLEFPAARSRREYYIKRRGAQVDGSRARPSCGYREALGETIAITRGGFTRPITSRRRAKAVAAKFGRSLLEKPEAKWLAPVRDIANRGDDGVDPRRSRGARRHA